MSIAASITNDVGRINGAGVGDDGNSGALVLAFGVVVFVGAAFADEFVVALFVVVFVESVEVFEARGVGVGVAVMVATTGIGRVASKRWASPMRARTLLAGKALTGCNGAMTMGTMGANVFVGAGVETFAFVFGAPDDALIGDAEIVGAVRGIVGDAFGAAFSVEDLTELFFDVDGDMATGAIVFLSACGFCGGRVFSVTLRGRDALPEVFGVREPARV